MPLNLVHLSINRYRKIREDVNFFGVTFFHNPRQCIMSDW